MTRYTFLFSSLVVACSLAVTTTAFSPTMHRGSLTQPLMRGLQSQQRVAAAAAAPSFWTQTTSSTMKNYMSTDENSDSSSKSNLPFFLDPGTKGGAVFISLAAFIIPIIGYNIAVTAFDMDGIEVGKWIGAGFTIVATLGWVASYIFRVANKDMTYAKQLKDYENAVIAKRMEELDEDELQALVEEVERDEF